MMDPPVSRKRGFADTPRRRRLRTTTAIILWMVVIMLAFSVWHPFFQPQRPVVVTQKVKNALAIQGMLILAYYTIVFCFALSLVVIAWLYARDVRLQLVEEKIRLLNSLIGLPPETIDTHGEEDRNGTSGTK